MNTNNKNRHSRSDSERGPRRRFSRNSSKRGKFDGNRGRRRGGGSRGVARKMSTFNPSKFINTNPAEYTPEVYKSKHSFKMFDLHVRLQTTISKMGIVTPTPIQDQIIPEILKGRDVIGLAETGTGKTAAFLIPLIERTIKAKSRQTLVLTPTRELSIQIEEELRQLSLGLGIYSVTCVGGVNIRPQIKALRRTNQFIIGTPGRVLDLLNRGDLKTRGITNVVLDEADRMLDMGFINDIRKILAEVPENREMALFSATMPTEAEKIVQDFLRDPVTVSVKKKDVIDTIEQNIIPYEDDKKFDTLLEQLSDPEFKRVIIFGSMKHRVERLSRKLSANKVEAMSIHGNKNHSQRQRALQKFKNGQARVLVATDVASRGIHVEDVTHVINYDLPKTFEDYVHRIGRTGRSTKRGKAITFVPTSSAKS